MSLIDFENEKPLSERIAEFCNLLLLQTSQENQEYILDDALDALYTLKLMQRGPTLDMLNAVFNEWSNEKQSNEVVESSNLFSGADVGQFILITSSSDEFRVKMLVKFFCDYAFQKGGTVPSVAIFLSTITISSFLRKVVDHLEFMMTKDFERKKKPSYHYLNLYDEVFRLLEKNSSSIDFCPELRHGMFLGTLVRLKNKYNTSVVLLDNIPQDSKCLGNMSLEKYMNLIAEENKVSIALFKSNND